MLSASSWRMRSPVYSKTRVPLGIFSRAKTPAAWMGEERTITRMSSTLYGYLCEQELLHFQLADHVAQFCGNFEVKTLRGFAHVAFQFCDVGVKFLLRLEFRQAAGFDCDFRVIGLDDSRERHIHGADDRERRDVVFFVVGHLDGATAIGFSDGFLHGVSHAIGVEDGATFEVAGGASDGLDERSGGTEETFLVGVENGNQRDFRKVESFAKEIDANQYVEFALAQIAQDLDALEGLDLR